MYQIPFHLHPKMAQLEREALRPPSTRHNYEGESVIDDLLSAGVQDTLKWHIVLVCYAFL